MLTRVTNDLLEGPLGSGGGVVNLFTNGDSDTAIASPFVPYADAAGTRPVNGTGGTANVTTGLSSSNPLKSVQNYTLVKGAANRQGEGWAMPDTAVPLIYRAKPMKLSVKYIIASGTFVPGSPGVDGDVIWYAYDVTNSKLIEPSNIKMYSNSTSISDVYEGTIQVDYNCASIRVMAHVATTSTSAYTIHVTDVALSPMNYTYGSPISDWSAQETTTGTHTSNVSYNRKWRREGDSIRERIQIIYTGATTSATLQVNTKFTVDTAKLNGGAISNAEAIGIAALVDVSTGIKYTGSVCFGSSSTQVRINGDSATGGNWSNTNPTTIASGDYIEMDFLYPAAGLSSTVRMSDQEDGRLVSFKAYKSGGDQNGTSGVVSFTSAADDTHAAFNLSGGYYVVPVAGDYWLTYMIEWTGAQSVGFIFRINGVQTGTYSSSASSFYNSHSILVPKLKVGDQISVSSGTGSVISLTDFFFFGFRVAGPQAIAESERIGFSAATAVATSLAATTSVDIPFVATEDTHGGWDGDEYTVKGLGSYSIDATLSVATASCTQARYFILILIKNGVGVKTFTSYFQYTGSQQPSMYSLVFGNLSCKPGDVLKLQVYHNNTSTLALSGYAEENWLNIKRNK